jgi:hypothetical protein
LGLKGLVVVVVVVMEDSLVADGVIAQDISQASNFWRIHEVIIQ